VLLQLRKRKRKKRPVSLAVPSRYLMVVYENMNQEKEIDRGVSNLLGPARASTKSVAFNWADDDDDSTSNANALQPLKKTPPAQCDEVPAAPDEPEPRAPQRGWTMADATACRSQCKRCQQPIVWGKVTVVFGACDDPREWIPVDPDGFLHVCVTAASAAA